MLQPPCIHILEGSFVALPHGEVESRRTLIFVKGDAGRGLKSTVCGIASLSSLA